MRRVAGSLAVVALLASACQTATAPLPDSTAVAELRDAGGKIVGTATFTQLGAGVRLVLDVKGLPPGAKGVHLHEVGRCEAPRFVSAGGHFNPRARRHGLLNPEGPHAGDLPNITIGPDGSGRLETLTDRVTLSEGPTSLFDADGSALVVHAGPDDFRTDPTGNSGDRIACGAIGRPRTGSAAPPAGPRY
jgi:Cu-Zn family superoxide dismutase